MADGAEVFVRRDYSVEELRRLPDDSKVELIELYQQERQAMLTVIEAQVIERALVADELERALRELARMREKD